MEDVHGGVEEDLIEEEKTSRDKKGVTDSTEDGHGEDGGKLEEEFWLVEVVGGVEDDGRDEEGVDGQVWHAEAVEGG